MTSPGTVGEHRAREAALRGLVRQLQLAHAGELAAAWAYRGHWRSLGKDGEREAVRRIELEERHHRELIGGMLARLGRSPRPLREARAWVIGRTLGLACHVTGWFLPMYGAGRLELRNVEEYEVAVRLARAAGRGEFVACLAAMADVEREHEAWFRERVGAHWLSRWIRPWTAPPERKAVVAPVEVLEGVAPSP